MSLCLTHSDGAEASRGGLGKRGILPSGRSGLVYCDLFYFIWGFISEIIREENLSSSFKRSLDKTKTSRKGWKWEIMKIGKSAMF